MRKDLKAYLLKHINVNDFYTQELDNYRPGENARCPFHKDDVPSLSIRKEDGAYFCHGCGAKGTSLIGFYESSHNTSFPEALSALYGTWIRPTVPLRRVSSWALVLAANGKVSRWIEKHRGANRFTMKMLRLGWDGERIVIPIINEYGLCINVRRYHPKNHPKMLSYKKGYGGVTLFPLDKYRISEDSVLLVEGEWDAILAWQMGYNVLTTTGGAGAWKPEFNKFFKGKDVVICYDNDPPGREGAERAAGSLQQSARSIKIIREYPKSKGDKDLTDFVLGGTWDTSILDKIIASTDPRQDDERETKNSHDGMQDERPRKSLGARLKDEELVKVKLHEASKSEMFYKPIETQAHVTGKRLAPYLPAKSISVRCRMDRGKLCLSCHMLPVDGKKTITISPRDRRILALVEATDLQIKSTIKDIARIPSGCSIDTETLSTFSMEEITVIPPIDDLGGSYTARRAYYVGHGLPSNRGYIFEGYTVPHPRDQTATHIFTHAETAQSHLETYELTPTVIESLKKFSPTSRISIADRISEIEKYLSENVTKILRRRTMHLAIDLVFHSPIAFYFNNEKVKKGWLEAAIIGDTRCGKGYVATELVRFYGLGEIATAENCSFAGLIGGLMKMGNTFSITWGVIPRNTDRLVIIDETSGLSHDAISKMTRVRSEGIAEIFKIQSEATQARTRLIWLSNTRSGRPVNTYAYGVEAVSELFGKAEDVSKLDYCLVVQSGDVAASIINAPRQLVKGDAAYERDDFRNLIMWVWTRGPHQIFFTPEATRSILNNAMALGKRYHSSIPLIQVEDVRIKLARISAAIAGRVFSADPTGKNLVVTEECARYAVSFLQRIYDMPPTSYKAYSDVQFAASTIDNEPRVVKLVNASSQNKPHLISGLLDTRCITITDVTDFMDCDKFVAKDFIGALVRNRCLVKEYTYYVKRPAFIELLRRLK